MEYTAVPIINYTLLSNISYLLQDKITWEI